MKENSNGRCTRFRQEEDRCPSKMKGRPLHLRQNEGGSGSGRKGSWWQSVLQLAWRKIHVFKIHNFGVLGQQAFLGLVKGGHPECFLETFRPMAGALGPFHHSMLLWTLTWPLPLADQCAKSENTAVNSQLFRLIFHTKEAAAVCVLTMNGICWFAGELH